MENDCTLQNVWPVFFLKGEHLKSGRKGIIKYLCMYKSMPIQFYGIAELVSSTVSTIF